MTDRLPSRLLFAPDARAAERELLAEVERAQADDLLARVTIVVPSHRLRTHVLALLVRGGRARLGIQVLTLRALAGAIAARTGATVGDVEAGEALFELEVVRLASRERVALGALAQLEDGYAGIAATVSDLLDAGFLPEHREEAGELLRQEGAALGGGAIDRALAVLRIAARLPEELAARGAALAGSRLTAATEAVLTDPERALPAARVVVHGIADATGVASDLLQAIFGRIPTTFLLPVPTPLDARDGAAWRFGQRLRERLEGSVTPEALAPSERDNPAAKLSFQVAPDVERETRDAIDACAATMRAGAPPEGLAIVARDLGPYRPTLEREIDRRAFPASGAAGGEHPAAAVARAWTRLLERGPESPLELLLAAVGRDAWGGGAERPVRGWRLRREAAERGLRRLADIASAAPERRGSTLGRIATPLRRIVRELDALGKAIELGEAGTWILRLLEGAALPGAIHERLANPLALLSRPAVAGIEVQPRELRALVGRLWERSGERALGGDGESDGAGAALLSVTEARGLSFERVRLVGLSRDRFPRRVRSDPFLPDPLRARLRTLLPDLPVKGEGHDEERFLFAELLASSPHVELSAPARDEDGRELPRSSLVDELDRAGRLREADSPAVAPRPAIELAIAESLATARLGDRFAEALSESRTRFAEPIEVEVIARLAEQSRRLLLELSADPADAQRRDRLGPFFGFVGAAADGDRRSRAPFVTALEAHARCGWRMFLERLLRLRPPPAVEEEIPSLPPRLAGSTLHLFLERLAPDISGIPLSEAEARQPVAIAWPKDVERRLEEAAIETLRKEGIDAELFAPALFRAARELAEIVRVLDWPSGLRETLAVESEGFAEVPADRGAREVRFRVDRVERAPGNEILLLTDYKSGAPIAKGKKATTRDGELLRAVAEGQSLQLAAYALARLESGTPVAGRLLFAKADLDDALREVLAERGHPSLAAAPWATLFRARDLGAFTPRLLAPDLRSTYDGCDYCEVRIACIQGDSGARLRFGRWAASGLPELEARRSEPERAARALFELHAARRREAPAGATPADGNP